MRAERIDLRVTREEKLAYFKAAQREGVRLADWIRLRCGQAMADDAAQLFNNTVRVAVERLDRKACKHGLLFCKKCK